MRRLAIFVLAMCLLVPAAWAEETPEAEIARALAGEMARGEYAEVAERFSEALGALLSEDALKSAYETYARPLGEYRGVHSIEQFAQDKYQVVQALCAYDEGGLMYTLSFLSGKLEGIYLSIAPISEIDGIGYPLSGVTREEILLRPGQADETAGLLTLPAGEGPFPAVVLVHGSGPSDMDQTLYANRPFRDVAEGLAVLGVASIRYDKYTLKNYAQLAPEKQARFTVQEEYIFDALEAIALLKADARIGDIYVLGHSQGAMLTPRIIRAAGEGAVAGGILLAGTPKALWEVSLAQNLALIPGDQLAAATELLEEQIALAKALKEMSEEELLAKTVFGLPAYYQRDEISVSAAEAALQNAVPLFIAQGDADWQVTPAIGLDAWREALANCDFPVEYRLYPGLNHLFIAQVEPSAGTVEDYLAPGEVSSQLIADVAEFILGA